MVNIDARMVPTSLQSFGGADGSRTHNVELAGRTRKVAPHRRAAHIRSDGRRDTLDADRRERDGEDTFPNNAAKIDEEGLGEERRAGIG